MKIIVRILSVVFCVSIFTNVLFAQKAFEKELDFYIDNARVEWNIPGLAIALIKDGKVIYEKGFGVKELGKEGKVDENTLFSVASNTKAFTALAVGLLVQQGKLSWDEPVVTYLPNFEMYDAEVTRKITLRDFLSHKSGLGLWAGDLTWWESNYSRDEVIRRIRFQIPKADLHQKYMYSNLGYLVAGEVVAKVSGMTYDEFIKINLFEPLEMKRSRTTVRGFSKIENIAIPHSVIDGELSVIGQMNVDNCAPAAAVVSSVEDLSHWVEMQLAKGVYNGKRIADERIIEETRKPQSISGVSKWVKENLNPYTNFSNYALGWRVYDFRGRYVVEHTGGLDGMLSYVGFIPEMNVGVVMVTNSDNHDLQNCLPKYLFDRLTNVEEDYDWSGNYLKINKANKKRRAEEKKKAIERLKTDAKPTLPIEDYVGEYVSDVYGTATLYMNDGKLEVKLSAHPGITGSVSHLEYNTFSAKWNHRNWKESPMYFRFDGRGNIVDFKMSIRPDWIDTYNYTWVKCK